MFLCTTCHGKYSCARKDHLAVEAPCARCGMRVSVVDCAVKVDPAFLSYDFLRKIYRERPKVEYPPRRTRFTPGGRA